MLDHKVILENVKRELEVCSEESTKFHYLNIIKFMIEEVDIAIHTRDPRYRLPHPSLGAYLIQATLSLILRDILSSGPDYTDIANIIFIKNGVKPSHSVYKKTEMIEFEYQPNPAENTPLPNSNSRVSYSNVLSFRRRATIEEVSLSTGHEDFYLETICKIRKTPEQRPILNMGTDKGPIVNSMLKRLAYTPFFKPFNPAQEELLVPEHYYTQRFAPIGRGE